MKLPAAEHAWIEPAKVRDYLLSPVHPVGRFKAAFFVRFGYTREGWRRLEADLLRLAREGEAEVGRPSAFGRMFLVRGTLGGPSGRTFKLVTVWIIRHDEAFPRLVTATPGAGP